MASEGNSPDRAEFSTSVLLVTSCLDFNSWYVDHYHESKQRNGVAMHGKN